MPRKGGVGGRQQSNDDDDAVEDGVAAAAASRDGVEREPYHLAPDQNHAGEGAEEDANSERKLVRRRV